jgi:hypothetical protein
VLIPRHCSEDDRIINESGAVDWMRIGSGNQYFRRNLSQYHFVPRKSHMTWDRSRAAAVGSW